MSYCFTKTDEICAQPAVSGFCLAYFKRWFHNSATFECEKFVYGGCQGNDNNFSTKDECEAKCKSKTFQGNKL